MSGRVVVVTGASAGVGRAITHEFAARGASVGLLARESDRLEQAAEDVRRRGGRALAVPTDVADAEQVERAAERVEDRLGPIDCWVNNAMTGVFAPFERLTPEEYARVTTVTYLGCVNGTRAALRRMRPRDAGHVVQIGSALAYRGIPLQTAYCGAKHAIQGFSEALRAELLHDKSGVHLTVVHLPAMNTPQFRWVKNAMPRKPQPVPPIFQPEVAARAVVWASVRRRREVWVTATTVGTILGNRLAPGLLDHYLGRTGVGSQLTDEPADPMAPYNLWEPVAGDEAAHGVFDGRAHGRSLQVPLTEHRRSVGLAALGAAGAAALTVVRRARA